MPGIADSLHRWVFGQPCGDCQGIVVVALHSEGQGLHAAGDEPGVERADRSSQVAQRSSQGLLDEVPLSNDYPPKGVAVTAQELGGRMNGHVNTQ